MFGHCYWDLACLVSALSQPTMIVSSRSLKHGCNCSIAAREWTCFSPLKKGTFLDIFCKDSNVQHKFVFWEKKKKFTISFCTFSKAHFVCSHLKCLNWVSCISVCAQGNSRRGLQKTIAVIQRELSEAAHSANSAQNAYDRRTSGPLVSDVYVCFTCCIKHVGVQFCARWAKCTSKNCFSQTLMCHEHIRFENAF